MLKQWYEKFVLVVMVSMSQGILNNILKNNVGQGENAVNYHFLLIHIFHLNHKQISSLDSQHCNMMSQNAFKLEISWKLFMNNMSF